MEERSLGSRGVAGERLGSVDDLSPGVPRERGDLGSSVDTRTRSIRSAARAAADGADDQGDAADPANVLAGDPD